MEGFIVEAPDGTRLSPARTWFVYEHVEDAWVHSLDDLKAMDFFIWIIKPELAYPAKHENGKTVLTGDAIDFSELLKK